MRVGVFPLPFLEKLYLYRLDRAIVEVKFQLVRDEDSVDGLAEDFLVKLIQAQNLTASLAEPVAGRYAKLPLALSQDGLYHNGISCV